VSFKLVSLKYTHHFFAGNKRIRTIHEIFLCVCANLLRSAGCVFNLFVLERDDAV